jgi:FAD/FMN-containing dehydrogenase
MAAARAAGQEKEVNMSLSELAGEPDPLTDLDDAVGDILAPASAKADVDELRSRVHGPVHAAGEDGLAGEVASWNLATQHAPAIAVGATCDADVAAAVSWAAVHGLRVAVQATGHGPVAAGPDSMLITTRRMQGVRIDPGRRIARVEAGVTWHRLLQTAAESGLAGPSGSSSGVGVVGYTLGGGLGPLGRHHGFAADLVTAVEIVTADGRLRRVSAESEPELFWAVRGAKSSLGVVTALEMELVPLADLYAGGIFFAGADAGPVLHAFRTWAPTLPEEVSTSIAIIRIPDLEFVPELLRGQTALHLRYTYSGTDLAEGERLVAPMRAAGEILLDLIGRIRSTDMDSIHMDPVDPLATWEKGLLLSDVTEETVEALLAAAGPQVHLPLMIVELRLMGGQLARQPEVPNAVPGRGAAFAMLVIGPGAPELAQVVPAAAKGVLGAMHPWKAPEGIVNFLGRVSGPEEVAAAYSLSTLERLRTLKAAFDPAGVFSFGHAL